LPSAKSIGAAGEYLACSIICSYGWAASLVDAEGYDIIATRGRDIMRVQAKTTRIVQRAGRGYQWQVCRGGQKQALTIDDCDVVALVALDVRKLAFIAVGELNGQLTKRVSANSMLSPGHESDSWETALGCLIKRTHR
jgi:hypothetical protein